MGTPLSAEVKIVPNKEFPFNIKEVKAQHGDYITHSLKKLNDGTFSLAVENKNTNVGRFFDTVDLITDRPGNPKVTVRVIGIITDNGDTKSVNPFKAMKQNNQTQENPFKALIEKAKKNNTQ